MQCKYGHVRMSSEVEKEGGWFGEGVGFAMIDIVAWTGGGLRASKSEESPREVEGSRYGGEEDTNPNFLAIRENWCWAWN